MEFIKFEMLGGEVVDLIVVDEDYNEIKIRVEISTGLVIYNLLNEVEDIEFYSNLLRDLSRDDRVSKVLKGLCGEARGELALRQLWEGGDLLTSLS